MTLIKRKFRYTLEGILPGGVMEPVFVRPYISFNQISAATVVNLYEYDTNKNFWDLVQTAYVQEGENPESKFSKLIIKRYDGCGFLLETWPLEDAYFNKIEMWDWESNDYIDFEIHIRHKPIEMIKTEQSSQSIPCCFKMGIGQQKVKCPQCQHEFMS